MQYGKFIRRVYVSDDEWWGELTTQTADGAGTKQHRESGQLDKRTASVGKDAPSCLDLSSAPLLEKELGI